MTPSSGLHERAPLSPKRALACTVGDASGHLIPKIRQLLPAVTDHFGALSVVAMTVTPTESIELLNTFGIVHQAEPDGRVGLHRRQAIKHALTSSEAELITYFDLDHVLRWLERAPVELENTLSRAAAVDCLVIGRSERSFAQLPRRLRDTETIVNHVFRLATGHRWDIMMAARAFSREGAELVVGTCTEESIANDVTWPLICIGAGLRVDYAAADGLTYEINETYGAGVADNLDTDPHAWIRRVNMAAGHLAALERLTR